MNFHNIFDKYKHYDIEDKIEVEYCLRAIQETIKKTIDLPIHIKQDLAIFLHLDYVCTTEHYIFVVVQNNFVLWNKDTKTQEQPFFSIEGKDMASYALMDRESKYIISSDTILQICHCCSDLKKTYEMHSERNISYTATISKAQEIELLLSCGIKKSKELLYILNGI